MNWQNLALPFVTAITVASLQAQTPDASPSASPGWKHHGRGHHAWIWHKLNLTESQKHQIRMIRQNAAFRKVLADYLQAKQKVLADVKANASPIQDAPALGTAEANLAVARAQQENEIKAVLSQEQLQTWNDFQAKRESFLQKRIEKLTSQPNP